MILNRLSILNYKNISEATLELSPKINCFIGSNGMGKTNVLDAVSYLSFCRSINSLPDSQLIKHDTDFFVLEADYENEQGDIEHIYCGMKRGTKKHFKRNGKEYKRLSQHIGLIPIIIISPSDTSLIDGSSEFRRKMMDVVISQYEPTYIDILTRCNNALQQRNALLKQEIEPDPSLLDLWEEEMAANGEQLFRMRSEFIDRLTPVFQRIYSEISEGREKVELHYVSHCQRGPLLDVIRRDRMKDRAVGYSLHGVHRDDLEMTLDGFPLRREGSQGQLKTYVIALKLSQFDFLRQTVSQTTPLLLLDDIFDKLDAHRVEQIVRLVSSDTFGQIFITDTNRDHLDSILSSLDNSDDIDHSSLNTKHYSLFEVCSGNIQRQ